MPKNPKLSPCIATMEKYLVQFIAAILFNIVKDALISKQHFKTATMKSNGQDQQRFFRNLASLWYRPRLYTPKLLSRKIRTIY